MTSAPGSPVPRGARPLAATGATAGLVLLTRPQQVLDAVAPAFPRDRAWLVRALGVRMLAQHAAVLARPAPALLRAGAGIDLLHAASLLPFLASARYGRAARVSAAVALGSAVASRVLAGPQRRSPGRSQRRSKRGSQRGSQRR
ncbi:hypothetical protein JKP75_12260 [Blastococcus sp. TML/M2B]|uniref:hypothetical protein n=1 Tax=unclassified Blastococcus TaxID=2619396 RepID=UPI00190E2DA4|nr:MULTISPECIES: hypothetical protein [unclassified Blastococcus]MBN1093262.1 hypothetical protein [Blastococcus sp. TML/M2B]MBN1096627.1 hypothetical protein [Blastococcus sp. TML/C7B]